MNPSTTVISVAFFGLAGWFFFVSPAGDPPLPEVTPVNPEDIATEARRTLLSDPPLIDIGGQMQSCEACHSLFETNPDRVSTLYQHEHIVLDHGLNDRCLNCHSTTDRDKLVLHGDQEIGYDDVQMLCSKCHGPTFRDWERGMHGKTMGSWAADSGEQHRLKCTECHDPHAPAYPHIVPLPGPNTLRMGDPHSGDHVVDPSERSVLQRWRGHGDAPAHGKDHE